MDAQRRARIEALFERALERPLEERETWLREACREEPELVADVRALLEAHGRDGGFLDRGVSHVGIAPPERPRPPRPLGPYRLLGELGRGGMSVVYQAERADGHFRRRVAIKFLKGDLDAEELHARLAAERQILAALDHSNIARLLDGGVTDEGRPYLVMEYVEGRPLHAYCDAERLSVEDRLRIFLDVARAVQHAHAHLVIHRDLKPSNILVTRQGQVRLLDFGIAKVLDVRSVGLRRSEAPVTQTGVRMFTPEYASPEQLRGEPASISNDVWALGVVLYQLLTGSRPFDTDGGSVRDIERAVLEDEPVRPSLRVLESGPAEPRSEARAQLRGSTPGALARRLHGDLDRIVLMALRKETERRYLSADQLAEDVERHLAGMPVRAQPDRVSYRVGKFVRRHRIETAAVVVVLVSVLAGSGIALQAAHQARAERDRAEEAARHSDAVSAYLLDLFRTADPWEVPADRLTARELLQRGERRLEALPDEPVIRARILLAMGQIHQSLGDASAARPLLEEAVELRRASLGVVHRETAEALRALGETLRRDGELRRAEATALEALEASRMGEGGPDFAGEAAALDLLGFIRTGMSRLDDAEADFTEALEVLRRAGLEDDPAFGHGLVNLAAIQRRHLRYSEAERYLREALEHRRRTLGPEDPLTTVSLARLGGLLSQFMGRHDEAEALFLGALEIQDRVLGLDHPRRQEALSGLAHVYEQLGQPEKAEHFYREAVRTLEDGLGDDHPSTLLSIEHLADHLARKGRFEEADSMYRTTLVARRRPDAGALAGRGRILLELGRLEEAEAALREAVALREAAFGPGHPLVALALQDLGRLYVRRGELEAGERVLRRALAISEGGLPPGHQDILGIRESLARLYEEWDRPADAARARASLRER